MKQLVAVRRFMPSLHSADCTAHENEVPRPESALVGSDTCRFTPPDAIFTDRGLIWMVCRHRDLQSGCRAICSSGQDKQSLRPRFLAVNSTRIFPFAWVRRCGVLATEVKSLFILVT